MAGIIPDVSLIDNSDERAPLVLVLDCSGSMGGQPMQMLNEGLNKLAADLKLSEDENYRENRRDAVEHATKIHETKLKSKDQHHKHAMDIAKHHHEHRVHEHGHLPVLRRQLPGRQSRDERHLRHQRTELSWLASLS